MTNQLTLDEILIALEMTVVRDGMTQGRRTGFKQQLSQLIGSIIGEDDVATDGRGSGGTVYVKNSARAEQRQRAKDAGFNV